jgi:hypothetical protein
LSLPVRWRGLAPGLQMASGSRLTPDPRAAANAVKDGQEDKALQTRIVRHRSRGRATAGPGRGQLMTEAIDVALAGLFDELDRALTEADTFPDAIGVIAAPWRRLLVDHDFAMGCPLAATVVDAADNDDLRDHVGELLARWQASVAGVYVRFGDSPPVADEQSTVLLAALEGALILARARRSTEPLDTVERYFASRAPDPRTRRTESGA